MSKISVLAMNTWVLLEVLMEVKNAPVEMSKWNAQNRAMCFAEGTQLIVQMKILLSMVTKKMYKKFSFSVNTQR